MERDEFITRYVYAGVDGICGGEPDGDWVAYKDHRRVMDKANAEINALKDRVRDREAEILRIRTHENAAAHELDLCQDPEQRAKFKATCDKLASAEAEIAELKREIASLHMLSPDNIRSVIKHHLEEGDE